jgi:hypothetical protein
MEVKKLGEYGYEFAALGFSLSYNTSIERTKEILPKYAFGIPGEGKFLEMIVLWLDVTAPRYLWAEMDTYRLSTKQSESTMHTLKKKPLSNDSFEDDIPEFLLDFLNTMIANGAKLIEIKNVLPEGFLQRRIWMFSYKTFRNIYEQRLNHRLPQWKYFCTTVLESLEYPEFIVKDYVK